MDYYPERRHFLLTLKQIKYYQYFDGAILNKSEMELKQILFFNWNKSNNWNIKSKYL
jgi:hypothetical protein